MTSTAPGGRATSIPLLGRDEEPTIFELSAPGRSAWSFRRQDLPEWDAADLVPAEHLADAPPPLPEVAERDLVAHFTRLSHRQYAVDLGAYPLGSCTMKYNPKLCDAVAAMPGLALCHPAQPADQIQGWLALLADLERKALWLSSWIIHHANHIRPNRDGLKVGGHQASSASVVTSGSPSRTRRRRPRSPGGCGAR